jgi:hypothetical protein
MILVWPSAKGSGSAIGVLGGFRGLSAVLIYSITELESAISSRDDIIKTIERFVTYVNLVSTLITRQKATQSRSIWLQIQLFGHRTMDRDKKRVAK